MIPSCCHAPDDLLDKTIDIWQLPEQVTNTPARWALLIGGVSLVGVATIIMVVLLTGLFTLAAVMYNLISDMVGGVEVIVLEETYNVAPQTRPQRAQPAVLSGNGRADDADTEPVPAPTSRQCHPRAMPVRPSISNVLGSRVAASSASRRCSSSTSSSGVS